MGIAIATDGYAAEATRYPQVNKGTAIISIMAVHMKGVQVMNYRDNSGYYAPSGLETTGTHFDYITLTSPDREFFERAQRLQKLQGGELRKQGRKGGYQGIGGANIYTGWNLKSHPEQGSGSAYLVSIWGNTTQELLNKLYIDEYPTRVTRYDLQRTIRLVCSYPLVDVYKELVASNLHTSLLRGDNFTLTLGSRKSERYFRLYEKNVDRDMYLRLELEVKGETARKTFNAVRNHPDARTAMLQSAARRFPKPVQSDFFSGTGESASFPLLYEVQSDTDPMDRYLQYVQTALHSLLTKRELAFRDGSPECERYEKFCAAMVSLLESRGDVPAKEEPSPSDEKGGR